MKRKLTILMFSLCLAVGWTSSVFAQSSTFTADSAKTWTYSWTDANGRTYDNVDPTLEVTNAYQMYYLLRHVYMDKHFPGPYQSAYKADGVTRERNVYYGGMDSGWEIPGTAISAPTSTTSNQITFNQDADYGSTTISKSGVTITTTNGNLAGTYNQYRFYAGSTTTISTNTGKITSIQFNGSSSGYAISNLTPNSGTLTPSGNNGTWTGSASSVSFTASSQARCTQIIVTVETTTGGESGIGDIIISGTNNNAVIKSINVTSGGTTLFSWNYLNNYLNFMPGMLVAGYSEARYFGYGGTGVYSYYYNNNYGINFNSDDLNPIILQGWLFDGYSSVTVTIQAFSNSTTTYGNLTINNDTRSVTSTTYNNPGTYTWTISAKNYAGPTMYDPNQYKPSKEGYTALVVKLRNNPYLKPDETNFAQQCFYNSKDSIISYLSRNVKSIQLLTDGLRIGEGDKMGTVFNSPKGEYCRFFFLSKGQARQKSDMVVNEQIWREHLLGENVPFAQMFEQFSPTGGKAGDDIFDFYSEMMQGKVYRIIHDCMSVIQNEHEFSMAGREDTTAYNMTGMNFFIPDHRLQYWELTDTVKERVYTGNNSAPITQVKAIYTVDGRDMNPYQPASGTKTNDHSTFYETPTALAVWYAQYDTAQHAPLVGIYLIELNAVANPAPGYSEDNRYYQSTLDWTSSLNEMSGSGVSQTYIIYEVRTDSVTGEKYNWPIDTVENCANFHPQLTLDTLYEQHAHSYPVTYVIQGSPTDSDHPGFVAWSDPVTVIIPGYDDFMILNLHHYEADFDVNYTVPQGKNYYRNYLYPENDIANGITREAILGGYDSFILYRTSADGKVPVAKLKFAVKNNKVLYKITYFDENQDTTWRNDIDIDAVIQSLINTNN